MNTQPTTNGRTEKTDPIITSTEVKAKHFKQGMRFKVRSANSVFTVQDLGDGCLMATSTDKENYLIHIQLKKVGIIFWQWIGGVEIKSALIFYGNLILVSEGH
jgi:hypothetical protein